ncbi:hypothetical protein [Rheinheimera pacifica]|uniref:hypothetical protein n=1 Tax=Rheinheimera pacifica TaxID=173990 RepID=UPI002EDA851B
MAVHIGWFFRLNLNNKKRLNYFYILVKNILNDPDIRLFDSDSNKSKIIYNYFQGKFTNDNERSEKAKLFESLFNENCTPSRDFDWIDIENARQCYFIWAYIKAKGLLINSNLSNMLHLQSGFLPQEILQFCFSRTPSTPAECKEDISLFFDIEISSKDIKLNYIQELKDTWVSKNTFHHKMLKNLKGNDIERGKWFWNYLIEKCHISSGYLTPVTDSEYLPCAHALLDIWETSPEAKTIALDKAYNAFHSKTFQEKPAREKGANIWLGAVEMNQLIKISEKKGISTKLTLKHLLNSEFGKIFP